MESGVEIIILGNAQDGGFPQAGCYKDCCKNAWKNITERRFASSIAIVDMLSKKWWLIDATPDLSYQINFFRNSTNEKYDILPSGVFLTHAHIGHYPGLIFFGIEAIATKKLPVFAMPKMKTFLEQHPPFSQLVEYENITIHKLSNERVLKLTNEINILPFEVPHRNEFSETVGFKISSKNKSALYIPDIDSWEEWEKDILVEIEKVDFAFLDGTFFSADELPNRNMDEIKHPLVLHSIQLFSKLSQSEKSKIHFLHLNHTNPLLSSESAARKVLDRQDYKVAEQGKIFKL